MPRSSPTREHVLTFIKAFRRDNGYSPTVREIARHCGIKSTSVVQYHLNHLQKAGLITRGREKFRSLGIAGEGEGIALVPILGTISAGHPIWVPSAGVRDPGSERTIEVPGGIIRGRENIYALEVRGNSMVDAMIADSDIVLMEQADDIKNGDVAACWLENEQEVTLKKVFFENERVRLQPCNPYMLPIYHDATNVRFQGRVIAVIRVNP